MLLNPGLLCIALQVFETTWISFVCRLIILASSGGNDLLNPGLLQDGKSLSEAGYYSYIPVG